MEEKILWSLLESQKDSAIDAILDALKEVKREGFSLQLHEKSPALERITTSVKALEQIAYATGLVIIDDKPWYKKIRKN